MTTITPGRKPTLGEVLNYYTREDFLAFLFHVLQSSRVVTVISKKLHWEPDWERDEVKGTSVKTLKEYTVQKINAAYPDFTLDETLQFYPSFHQSVLREIEPGNSGSNQTDCYFEADLPTWRESFRDVSAAVTLMETHNVPYKHKFSGHRSLHILLPAEIIPPGYRGKGASKLAGHINHWSSSAAHHLPKITRMPYSLNEDTGLVCLPIPRGGLPGSRPWMANMHLVEIKIEAWYETLLPDSFKATEAFIEATDLEEAVTNPVYYVSNWENIAKSCADNLKRKSRENPEIQVWSRLIEESPMSLADLRTQMEADQADKRWLSLEAYLFHGEELENAAIERLLAENDEYGQVSATDILLKHEDFITPYLVNQMSVFDVNSRTGSRAALLLTMSESLRAKVLNELMNATGQSFDAIIISACLAGAVANDWSNAFQILDPVIRTEGLETKYRLQCKALHMMSDMGGWNRKQGAQQAQELASLGPGIVHLLLLAAGSPNRRMRRDMTTAMVELADPRTVEHLVRALGDDYSKVRRKAISALARIGAPAVDPLIEALDSDQANIRGFAATALGQIKAQKAKSALLELLDDQDETVRRRVLRALKNIVTEEDMPTLLEVVQQTLPEHMGALVETMRALGEPARLAMEKLAMATQHPNAAFYLAVCGDQRGRDILVENLASKDDNVVAVCVELLTELRDPNVVPFLADYLHTVTHWRVMWYSHALGEIGTPEAVDALITALEREYMFARRGAVRALSVVKDPRAIPYLIKALADEDSKIRGLAGEALLAIGEPSIKPLKQILEDEGSEAKRRKNRVRHLLNKLAGTPIES